MFRTSIDFDRGTLPRAIVVVTLLLAAIATGCGRSKEDVAFSRLEPELLSPAEGEVFDRYPRTMVLEWRKVPGAAKYEVEVELQSLKTGVWMPTPVSTNRQFTRAEKLYIEFAGAQPGRWRVVAFNNNDVKSRTSDWRIFEFVN